MNAIVYSAQALTDLLLVSLFTWAVVEVIHHGSLFAEIRAYADAADGRLKELLGCPFCLSHWVGILGTVLAALAIEHRAGMAYYILLWFGSVRLSNVFNDLTGSFKRMSGDDEFDFDEESHGRKDSESVGGTGQMSDDSEADAADDSTEDTVPPA